LSAFIQDEVSNWYVRRNRRRFWKGEKGSDKESAYATLHEVLATTARLLAPIAPFLSEMLHRSLVVHHDPDAPESVHLTTYPSPDGSRRDEDLESGMARAIAVTELTRAARSQAGIKVRLPLPGLSVLDGVPLDEEFLAVVRDEINVKQVEFMDAGEFLEYRLKASFKALGPRFGGDANRVAEAIKALDSGQIREGLGDRRWTVEPDHMDPVEISGSEAEVESAPPEGFVLMEDAGVRVALDTRTRPELEREGRVRELVHRLQNLRKEMGLSVTDRVRLTLGVDGDMRDTVEEHQAFIESEVLARFLEIGPPDSDHDRWEVDGETLTVGLRRSSWRKERVWSRS
jgi:isoleucyl-tRNA synthetase